MRVIGEYLHDKGWEIEQLTVSAATAARLLQDNLLAATTNGWDAVGMFQNKLFVMVDVAGDEYAALALLLTNCDGEWLLCSTPLLSVLQYLHVRSAWNPRATEQIQVLYEEGDELRAVVEPYRDTSKRS